MKKLGTLFLLFVVGGCASVKVHNRTDMFIDIEVDKKNTWIGCSGYLKFMEWDELKKKYCLALMPKVLLPMSPSSSLQIKKAYDSLPMQAISTPFIVNSF